MNKTVIVAGAIIFLIVSWLVGFVNDIQDDVDVSYGFHEKELFTEEDRSHYRVDINGRDVLELQTLSMEEKKRLWKESTLKDDMLAIFPDFSGMRDFINNQIEDDGLFKDELLKKITDIENEYIGGTISDEEVKRKLSMF